MNTYRLWRFSLTGKGWITQTWHRSICGAGVSSAARMPFCASALSKMPSAYAKGRG